MSRPAPGAGYHPGAATGFRRRRNGWLYKIDVEFTDKESVVDRVFFDPVFDGLFFRRNFSISEQLSGDNFDPHSSHVIPGMIREFCDAVDQQRDTVTCWGSGQVSREFLYVEDAAEAIVRATETYNESTPVNLGTGREITIGQLARMIASMCGFVGRIEWDESRPDGQQRRRLNIKRAAELLDWRAKVDLEEGPRRTIAWWKGQDAAGGSAGVPVLHEHSVG